MKMRDLHFRLNYEEATAGRISGPGLKPPGLFWLGNFDYCSQGRVLA